MFRTVSSAKFGYDAQQRKRARTEIRRSMNKLRQWVGRADSQIMVHERQRFLRPLDSGSQLVIAAQAARSLLFIKQQGADGVERGVIQLLFAQWTAAPIAALFGFIKLKAEMRFDLNLQRAT